MKAQVTKLARNFFGAVSFSNAIVVGNTPPNPRPVIKRRTVI